VGKSIGLKTSFLIADENEKNIVLISKHFIFPKEIKLNVSSPCAWDCLLLDGFGSLF